MMRKLVFALVASLGAAAAIMACSSSDDARPTFEEGPDSSRGALPEAAAPVDGGAESSADAKPPFDPKDEAVVCAGPPGTPCAVQLVAGEAHFCARLSDGTVRCWGDDEHGSLGVKVVASDAGADAGDAGDAGPYVPAPVTGLTGVTALSAGGSTTCALVGDGGVRCWGGNGFGQLGITITPPVVDDGPHPVTVPVALGGNAATRVDVGQRSACAVLTSGKLWCWGDNTQAQLARVTTTDSAGPGEAALGPVAWTGAGTNTGFGVTATGDLLTWGAIAGTEGSVAARTASVSPDAVPLSIALGPVTSLSVSSTTVVQSGGGFPRPPPQGVAHACAVVKGDVYCWGISLMGALGTGLPEPAPKPTRAVVESEKAWPQQVAAAGEITCVRLTDGSVQCAGDNARGALGKDPKQPFSMFFDPAETFTGHAVSVATSAGSVCALEQGGHVVCWGSNQHGELGLRTADEDPHATPRSIGF